MQPHPKIHWKCPAPPFRRIVSLVPSLSETIVALEMGDRLIGVTQYCVHPAKAFVDLPKLGGTKDADVDAISALAPDLVIANQEENTPRVVRALADRGIDVWVTYPRTVEEGVRLVEEIAGLGASAAAIARVVEPARVAFGRAAVQRHHRRERGETGPRVFCPIWRDPWMTIGRDTYIHDLLDLCGAENVFAADISAHESEGGRAEAAGDPDEPGERRYPKLILKELEALAPELILLPDEPYAFGPSDVAELSRLDLPAAKNGRIHLIDGTLVSWYGPRITEAIQVLGDLFAIS